MNEHVLTPAQRQAFTRLRAMMQAYLVERDTEKALSFFTENTHSIGTGVQEIALNKAGLRTLFEDEIHHDPLPFQIAYKEVSAAGGENNGTVSIYALLQVKKSLSTGVPLCVNMRQTAHLCNIGGEYYIRLVHASIPAIQQQENEYYPIYFGEQTLRQQHEKLERNVLSLLNETMPGGIFGGYNEPGFPLYFINNRMLEYLNYPSFEAFQKAINGRLLNSVPDSERLQVESAVTGALQKGGAYSVTHRMLKSDGEYIWVYNKGRCIPTEDGRKAIISVCFDITSQVAAQNELGFIAQSQIGGLFKARMDEGFSLLYANEYYYRMHGYTRREMKELLHDQAVHLVYPDDLAGVSAQIEQAIREKRESIALEYRIVRKDGTTAWLHASAGLSEANGCYYLSGMVINIDERKNFEQQLLWSEKRFQIAIEQTSINVWEYDLKTRSILQTDKSYQTFGIGKVIHQVPYSLIEKKSIHPDDAKKYIALYDKLHNGAKTASAVIRIRATDSQFYWIKINYTNIFDETGAPIRAVAVSEDITAQKEAEQRSFQEEHLREMLSADVLVSTKINLSQNKVLRIWSDSYHPYAFQDVISYTQLYAEVISHIANSSDKKRFAGLFAPAVLMKAAENGRKSLYGEYRCMDTAGHIIWCAFHWTIMYDPDSAELFAFGYIRDINERKKAELVLRERAERDALTGLYNRQTMESLIDQLIHQRRRKGAQYAFLMIDVDDFKQVNDTYGHYYGDQLLQEIGRILRTDFNGSSLTGRLGGDEFAVFFEDIPGKQWVTEIAARLCKKLTLSFGVNGEKLQVSASVGIVIDRFQGADFQRMFQQADLALYSAKSHGKAQYSCFNSQLGQPDELQLLSDGCVAKQHLGERCMLDEMDDSIFVIDEESHDVLFMNQAARQTFNIDSYAGRKCYDILQGFSQICVFCRTHLPEEHGFKSWENTNARLHKRFIIRDKIIRWDGKRARLEIFTDLSMQESRLHSNVKADRMLLESASLLLTSSTLGTAVRDILEKLGKFYRADRAYFTRVQLAHSLQIAPQEWRAPGICSPRGGTGRIEQGFLSIWHGDPQAKPLLVYRQIEQMQPLFPEKHALLREHGVSAFAAAILLDDCLPIGYIGLENPRDNLDNTTLIQSLTHFLNHEISKRRLQQQQLYMAEHDRMTGLLNWQSYSNLLAQLKPETLSSLGLLVADINRLRVLNQEYGHGYGDQLLHSLASAMKKEFSPAYVFRLDGDSFLAFCQDITYKSFLSHIHRLLAEVNRQYPGCVAFGWSWDDADISPDRIFNRAQEFLSVSKAEKKGAAHQDSRVQAIRLQRLQNTIQEGKFRVYLQPKAELSTGRLRGAEALVRYVDEVHGVVPPAKFIPQLETENIVRYIDFFMLEKVCAILQDWTRRDFPSCPISINFSRRTLMEDCIVEKISAVTDRYHLDHALFEIEITENIREIDRHMLREISESLVCAGYRISLDDFGSEYSNLSILSTLPLSGLKLDKSLIQDLYANPSTHILVKSLIQACHEMGIDSTAEGVEEEEQLKILQAIGCTYAQGYLFSPPLSVQEFEQEYLDYSSHMVSFLSR